MTEGTVRSEALRQRAIDVLKGNEREGYVAPARGLYVHQHLWDSCFIAIGQRHYDVRAAMEGLRRLVGAQWTDGMVPHIRFEADLRYWWDRWIWRSWVSSASPRGVATGGISQPPMLAEAVVRVGEMLSRDERLTWYRTMFPHLVAYHGWLHLDHGAGTRGLAVQIHPWETGLDNSPPLLDLLGRSPMPRWLDLVVRTRADPVATRLRWDTKYVPADQRSSTFEALRLYAALRSIRRSRYDRDTVLRDGPFLIEDLTYNSILVRANVLLGEIAREIGLPLPSELAAAIQTHNKAIDQFWDAEAECFYSRDARTRELIREPSIAALMPLYGGFADDTRVKRMVEMLSETRLFSSPYPVPSVPLDSPRFQPCRYWQGPTWINMNWLIIDGLRRYGFESEAEKLRFKTLTLVTRSGFYEYYHPLSGAPAGARDFSWTAALTVDLLADRQRMCPTPSA